MSNQQNVALITGASRGLGLALTKAIVERDWSVIITAREAGALHAARAKLDHREQVIAIPGDIANPIHRQTLAEAAHLIGGLDVVINNAGILGLSPQPPLLDYPLDALERVYQINVIAQLGILQAVWKELKPGAKIINVTSDAGIEPYANWGGYGSSKAALEQLSAILAVENPQLHIYWVDPGDMRTQMHQEAFPGEDISDRPLPEESVPGILTLLEGNLPSGRFKARELAIEEQV